MTFFSLLMIILRIASEVLWDGVQYEVFPKPIFIIVMAFNEVGKLRLQLTYFSQEGRVAQDGALL